MKRAGTAKKTYNLPTALIARAKRILKARTETEAIVRSLREVAFLDEVEHAVRSTSGRLPGYRSIR